MILYKLITLDEGRCRTDYNIDRRGVRLDERISLENLFKLEPQFFQGYCKAVVNLDSRDVIVGMAVHKNGLCITGDSDENSYGLNIFHDGHVVYESSLNVMFNVKNGTTEDDMRVISNTGLIAKVNDILKDKIEGLTL